MKRIKNVAIDSGASAVGAGVGVVIAGPPGAVIGAVIPPVLSDVLRRMLSKKERSRIEKVAELATQMIQEKINNGVKPTANAKGEKIKEFEHFGWKLRREEELEFLEQIKIIAEMMFVIYKRRGYFGLSKNGKAYLTKLKPLEQYKEIVLHYWYKVNWGYFSRIGRDIDGMHLAEKLQQHQNLIWKTLLAKDTDWLDYKLFCKSLSDYLHLDDYFIRPYYPYEKEDPDFDYELFYKNLVRLGCVELEIKHGKDKWDKKIVRFRSTDLGLYAYHKALFENYL